MPQLIDDTLVAMTVQVRKRAIRVEAHRASTRTLRHYATLRRALFAIFAETLDTIREGGALVVRCKDLAGGRVEIAIEDDSDAPTVVERALAPPDRSGRSTTLRDALRDLEREHQARVVAGSEAGKRRLLMDLGFPVEE